MALLRPRFLRVATYTTVLALSLHYSTLLLLPASSHVAGFIQISIAAVALGALIGIVLADYRRGGRLMKAVEEDVLIIAIVALFWLSFATVLRVFGRPPSTNTVHHIIRGLPGASGSAAAGTANSGQEKEKAGHRVYEGDLHQQPLYHHPHVHVQHEAPPSNNNNNNNNNGAAAQPQPNAQAQAQAPPQAQAQAQAQAQPHAHAHAHPHPHAHVRGQSRNHHHLLNHYRTAHPYLYQQPPPPQQQAQQQQYQQYQQQQYQQQQYQQQQYRQQQYQQQQYQQPQYQQQQYQQPQQQQATPANSDSEATPTLTLRYYSTQTPLSLRERLRGTTRSYVVVEDWMDGRRRR